MDASGIGDFVLLLPSDVQVGVPGVGDVAIAA